MHILMYIYIHLGKRETDRKRKIDRDREIERYRKGEREISKYGS